MTDWETLTYPLVRYENIDVHEFAAQKEIQCPFCMASIESNMLLVRTGLSSFIVVFVCRNCELAFTGRPSISLMSMDPKEYQ